MIVHIWAQPDMLPQLLPAVCWEVLDQIKVPGRGLLCCYMVGECLPVSPPAVHISFLGRQMQTFCVMGRSASLVVGEEGMRERKGERGKKREQAILFWRPWVGHLQLGIYYRGIFHLVSTSAGIGKSIWVTSVSFAFSSACIYIGML